MRLTSLVYLVLLAAICFQIMSYCGYDTRCQSTASEDKRIVSPEKSSLLLPFKKHVVDRTHWYIQSPHSELLLGMVMGTDLFKNLHMFNDVLLRTGTVHVVVVSGFNISLIYTFFLSLFGSRYKLSSLLIAQAATFGYALICGLEPPVVRAWIMGTIAAWGKYYGRTLNVIRILLFSAIVMVIVSPETLFSLSFQLSFLATLSLILFSGSLDTLFHRVCKHKSLLADDLITTCSAQILVWPLISYKFGRLSLVSPLVNTIILWTVPLATVLGFLFILSTFVSPLLASVISWLVYVPLDIFVRTVSLFGNFKWASFEFTIPPLWLFLYYLLIAVCVFRQRRSFT